MKLLEKAQQLTSEMVWQLFCSEISDIRIVYDSIITTTVSVRAYIIGFLQFF
jgi:hypothetical protein